METVIVIVFLIGYLLIAFEHKVNINKTASAIVTGVLCWTLFAMSEPGEALLSASHFQNFREINETTGEASGGESDLFTAFVSYELGGHLRAIAEILFFLMGAMTIVELIDAHEGFTIITDRIRTRNPRALLWIICWLSFFLSAILDNLTTTIVMVSLIRKLVSDREMRLFFTGMIVIAANAGGAWTPMGDVTTTMLWIGGQITTVNIMKTLFLPSVICMLVPLIYLSFALRGSTGQAAPSERVRVKGASVMLVLGLGVMLGVPAFKVVTHLPPYLGMMAGVGILWIVSELIHPELDEAVKKEYTAAGALSRIDAPSILFFLGILLAVGSLESMMTLHRFSEFLSDQVGDQRIIVALIGLLSAIVDNVPLVAAAIGMYSMETFPQDHPMWEFLAYCAGTGGSLLIIGSAAGVAAMGMERIDFIWYLKRVSLLALAGYAAGAIAYLLMNPFPL